MVTIGRASMQRRAPNKSDDKQRTAVKLLAIKSCGYLVSTVSVVLLGVVSWKSASEEPVLAACLVAGMAASVFGMFLRWLSYGIEERRKARSLD